MEVTSDAPRLSRRPHWVTEGVLIVVSVALGFGLAQFGEARADRRRADRALESLHAEIEANLHALEPLVPIHEAWVAALADSDEAPQGQSGIDVLFATRPPLPPGSSPFPILNQSAWDAAVSGEALRLLDFDVTTALSEVYRAQQLLSDNINRLTSGPLSDVDTYDPARRVASVRLLWLTVADILAVERLLLTLYEERLPQIFAGTESR